ncbi:MAG: sulfite exporter TauE/SafE family protein [Clostridia bacterium]|nr:sulfite exporter TauE/SafE family protein [Clostridia bacterium]
MAFLKSRGLITAAAGLAIGVVNGLLGAGGGMIAVPLLKKMGLEQREAHANAVAIILPISIVSAVLYLIKDYVKISDAIPFIPTGLLGAFIGTLILKKIKPSWLKRIFAVFMLYAGIRLLLR